MKKKSRKRLVHKTALMQYKDLLKGKSSGQGDPSLSTVEKKMNQNKKLFTFSTGLRLKKPKDSSWLGRVLLSK